MTALKLWTEGSAWFSGEQDAKGRLAPGRYADIAVLSADYFAVPESEISSLVSVLRLVGGRIVHGAAEYGELAPPLPPVLPEWSPVRAMAAISTPLGRTRITAGARCIATGMPRSRLRG
jgi:Amidohydrolase family